jgi:hypothetical protein
MLSMIIGGSYEILACPDDLGVLANPRPGSRERPGARLEGLDTPTNTEVGCGKGRELRRCVGEDHDRCPAGVEAPQRRAHARGRTEIHRRVIGRKPLEQRPPVSTRRIEQLGGGDAIAGR